MQAIDNVKPTPKTALEVWSRGINATKTKLKQLPISGGKKIEVKHGCAQCDKPIALGAYLCQDCMPEEEEC